MHNKENNLSASISSWVTFKLLRLLPIEMASGIGAALAQMYALNSDKRGHLWFKRLRSNMNVLSKDLAHQEINKSIYKSIRNSGRVMAEFAVIHRCINEKHIQIRGLNNLQDLRFPVMFVSLHTGNWEIISGVLSLQGIPFNLLYDPPQNETVHQLAVEARNRMMAKQPRSRLVAASPRAALQLVRAAESQKNLLIYVDEMKDGLIWSPALGRKLPPYGNRMLAARLAIKYNYTVLPVYARRRRGARFEVVVEAPIDTAEFSSNSSGVIELADQIASWTETRVLENLDQWYWLPELRIDRPFPARAKFNKS